MSQNMDFRDMCVEFLDVYYREDTGQLAQRYPSEQRSLVVDWSDILRYNTDMADDYVEQPVR